MNTILRIAVLGALASGAFAATHIHATLKMNDDATPMTGSILVTGPNGGALPPSTQTVQIGTGGVVDFQLLGCPGCKYTATYNLTTAAGVRIQQFQETWIVPNTVNTLTVKELWGGSAAPYYLVSKEQINPNGLLPGQTWLWDGSSMVAMYPSQSSIAGVLDPGASGVMKRTSLNSSAIVTGAPGDFVKVDGTSGPGDFYASAVGKAPGYYCTQVSGGGAPPSLVQSSSCPGAGSGGADVGLSGGATWAEVRAGTAPSGPVVGAMTWAQVKAL